MAMKDSHGDQIICDKNFLLSVQVSISGASLDDQH